LKIKEKNKCKILITQYEQTLEKREKSGNEMKEKIKELEEKIKNANL
jgi:phage shock protein A